MRDIEKTVISQYGNSPTLLKLICNMNEYIDPRADIDNFYNCIFDVTNSDITTFGLLVWTRIVGLSQSFLAQLPSDFSNSDLQSLILLKALSNISRVSAPALNQLLLNWLGAGARAYVTDTGNMTMVFNFEFALTATQLLIIQQSGIFLRPAGVQSNIQQGGFPFIGFAEMGQPWVTTMGNGIFSEGVM